MLASGRLVLKKNNSLYGLQFQVRSSALSSYSNLRFVGTFLGLLKISRISSIIGSFGTGNFLNVLEATETQNPDETEIATTKRLSVRDELHRKALEALKAQVLGFILNSVEL